MKRILLVALGLASPACLTDFGADAFCTDYPTHPACSVRVTNVVPDRLSSQGGATVEIYGSGFQAPARVLFDSTIGSSPEVVSATLIRVVAPPLAPGNVKVTVEVGSLSGTWSEAVVVQDPPAITGISPGVAFTGGPTSVVLTGSGFSAPGFAVAVGGASVSATPAGDTQATFTIDGFSPGPKDVTVSTVFGTATWAGFWIRAWQPISGGLSGGTVNAISARPGSPSTLLAATRGGLFRSGNDGSGWMRVMGVPPSCGNVTAVSFANANVAYATCSFQGVLKSIDAGQTWAQAATLAVTSSLIGVAADTAANTVVLASTDSLFLSTDGGATFSSVSGGPAGPTVVLFTGTRFVVAAQSGLFTSTGGAAWPQADLRSARCLAADPVSTPLILYACGATELITSNDEGLTWGSVGPAAGGNFSSVAVRGTLLVAASGMNGFRYRDQSGIWSTRPDWVEGTWATSSYFFSAHPGALTRSTDGMTGSQRSDNGIDLVTVSGLERVPGVPDPMLYAVSQFGRLFRTTTSATYQWAAVDDSTLRLVQQVRSGTNGSLYVSTREGLYAATDTSSPFNRIGTSSLPSVVFDAVPDRAGASTIFAGTEGGLYGSIDAGGNWNAVAEIPAGVTVWRVLQAGDRTWYAGTSNGTYRMSGTTWEVTTVLANTPVLEDVGGWIFAGTFDNGLWVSEDSGLTWTRNSSLNGGAGNISAISPTPDPSFPIYVGVEGSGLWKTSDRGVTWRRIDQSGGLPPNNVRSISIDPADPATVVIGLDDGGAMVTHSGGE